MAFAFGDSYLKLPPISKEGTVELDGENSKRGSGVVRDKHGLVRLPPIVRLDSLCSASSASRFRNETQTATAADSESELSTLIPPSKISQKMESLRHGSSSKFKKYTQAKREDETKLIADVAAKETTEDDARFFDGEEVSKQKNRFRLGSNTLLDKSSDDEDLMPLYKESVIRRRGSSTFHTVGKLTRSQRLAKSSPELSNRKINLRRRPESTLSSFTSGLKRPTSRSRSSQPRLSVHDIDGSVLSHLQNTSKIEEHHQKEHDKRTHRSNYRWANVGANQAQSTPSSPVCSESVNKEIRQKGRKSLNDITDAIQFTDRRRPSLTPKKQNLIQESEVLKIEGKSCVHNERETPRDHVPTAGHGDTLHPPKQGEKRHSLYDLQQILTLLQGENLKRQSSSPASTPRNTSATSSANDKVSNASVYDLREFLLQAASEASNSSAGQTKKKTNSSQHLLLPGQERDNSLKERKGSVYDLMEFLSLGGVAEAESSSASENSSRATSPRILLTTGGPVLNDSLSVATHAEEGRRSSTYDLMEFLSLSRSGGSSRSDSGQSSPALRGNDSSGVETDQRQRKENRSLSVYDLAEFLSMTSAVPPLVRVTPASDEEPTEASANLEQSPGATKNDLNMPRKSVYDLREILNVMQQEHERKRESTYNLQEILSKLQREGDEKSHISYATTNSNAKDNFASPSPPMTASSGYSTASDSTTSAKAKHSEASTSNRQMSVYDLKEFLSLYAAQQSQPNQQQLSSAMLRRKFSGVSQSGVSIHVTDESNRSIDSEVFEDVFLPVPAPPGPDPGGSSHKRSSVYDLREFLNILNDDDSPLRRRLSSVSSASSKTSESEPESNFFANSRKSDSNSAHESENNTAVATRPQLSPRQDSGGSMSLYDLGEFLSLLNTDESPLRRRLSSTGEILVGEGEIRVRTPVLSGSDSERGLYSLEEILTLMNDLEQKRINENTSGELEVDSGEEISFQVPTLTPKTEKMNTQPLSSRKRLQSQKSLKSVPETSEVKSNHSNSL